MGTTLAKEDLPEAVFDIINNATEELEMLRKRYAPIEKIIGKPRFILKRGIMIIVCTIYLATIGELRPYNEAPYNSQLPILIALLGTVQMQATTADPVDDDFKGSKRMFVRDRKFARHATNIYLVPVALTNEEVAKRMHVKPDEILFHG